MNGAITKEDLHLINQSFTVARTSLSSSTSNENNANCFVHTQLYDCLRER